MSQIEWTEATWNPISGCSRKSDGCKNCYAETMTKRLEAMGQAKYQRLLTKEGRFNGVVRLDEDALTIPLRRKKPTTYFVNSMSDLFHERVRTDWIDKIFAVMALCPQHTFQILTKRADRMREHCDGLRKYTGSLDDFWLGDAIANLAPFVRREVLQTARLDRPLPNVWLGVSVENQKVADERIPELLQTRAAVRFLSVEPLLEPVTLTHYLPVEEIGGVEMENWPDWVIVGGESGSKARPCHADWIRSIVSQCREAGVPAFVKQLGSNCYSDLGDDGYESYLRRIPVSGKGSDPSEWLPELEELNVREAPTGKKK